MDNMANVTWCDCPDAASTKADDHLLACEYAAVLRNMRRWVFEVPGQEDFVATAAFEETARHMVNNAHPGKAVRLRGCVK
jgi:hypothetical protein